ncbi:hypothetical protein GYMLUDRAFT_244296 [Collybiopsis luxurians FD-317 M1]|uniref:Uncharacterized protein n=1 Tax=Collybiopsis luxurians FD-317 M1 TaxID=944289 RepID=A0A0D0CX31_9AGAR|nr:hypothetical protein GYMLUDRAFT_244296 [Collybiopsis luxurians FD-317 M1]
MTGKHRRGHKGVQAEVIFRPEKAVPNVAKCHYTEVGPRNCHRTTTIAVTLQSSQPVSKPEKDQAVVSENGVTEAYPAEITYLDDSHSTFTYTFALPNAAEQIGEEVPEFIQEGHPEEAPITALKEWEPEIPRPQKWFEQ